MGNTRIVRQIRSHHLAPNGGRGSRSRLTMGTLAVLLLASFAFLFETAGQAALARGDGCPDQVTRDGAWTSITPPPGDGQERQIKAYAVHPKNPKVMFVAHNYELFRTLNGGCDWESVFRRSFPSDVGENPVAPYLVRLAIAQSSPDTVYAMWRTTDPNAGHDADVTIAVSRDAGKRWTEIELGDVVAEMETYDLHLSPSDPKIIYLSGSSGFLRKSLYASGDGGETWDFVYPQTADMALQATGAAPRAWSHLVIDPADPGTLWILGNRLNFDSSGGSPSMPYRSTDGGVTWEPVDPRGSSSEGALSLHAIDLARDTRSKATRVAISAYESSDQSRSIFWSDDGGTTWSSFPTPKGGSVPCPHFSDGSLPGMVTGKSSKELVVMACEGLDVSVYRLHAPTKQWVDMKAPGAPTGYTGMRHIIADRMKRPTFYVWRTGHEYADLLKFTP